MGNDFQKWWSSFGSERWAELIEIDLLKAIEMVFNAGVNEGYGQGAKYASMTILNTTSNQDNSNE